MSESEKVNSAVTKWKFQLSRAAGNIFCFYRSDISMGEEDRVGDGYRYMDRYIMEFGVGRRSIRLHIIYREDSDKCLHDHPWPFLALLLWGGYVEEIPFTGLGAGGLARDATIGYPNRQLVKVRPFRFHWRPKDYKHRIIRLLRRFSVSLVFAGPIENHWGFYTEHGKEPWENFVSADRATRVPWCDVS